jgi:hypothetical protein
MGKNYFVQARIISHVFDLKGAEKVLNMISESHSLYGSNLVKNGIKGVYFSEIKKTCFCDDYRIYANLKHKSRLAGQSGKCCPYINKITSNELSINNPNSTEYLEGGIDDSEDMKPNELLFKNIETLCITQDYNKDLLNNQIKGEYDNFFPKFKSMMEEKNKNKDEQFYIWHHYCHDTNETMCSNLFFPHCNYRYSKYERINNLDFQESVASKKNGFKGESFFSKLPYSDISTDFSWDIMHVIKNCASHLISIISGDRCDKKPNIKDLCKNLGCHPEYYKNGTQPWKISGVNQNKIDTFISCIRIPITYDFQVKMIFHPSGIIDCDDYQKIVTCLLDLIGFVGQLPYAYKEYLSMLQFDFNELLRPMYPEDYDYDLLFDLVNETGICKQGLFPYSELYFDGLQILDLPYSIRDIGPLRTYNSYTGERFNKDIKNHTKIGGSNSELTTFNCVAASSDLKTRYVHYLNYW